MNVDSTGLGKYDIYCVEIDHNKRKVVCDSKALLGLSAHVRGSRNNPYTFRNDNKKHIHSMLGSKLYRDVIKPNRYHLGKHKCTTVKDIFMLCQSKHALDTCVEDGNYNITPLLVSCNMGVSECRKYLGKALWKKLCSNTFTKNEQLVKCVESNISDTFIGFGVEYFKDLMTIASRLKENYLLDSHETQRRMGMFYIRSPFVVLDEELLWASNNNTTCGLVDDTKRMADNLNEKFSLKWSADKMQKMHDRYSIALQRQREEELLREQEECGREWEAIQQFLPCETIKLDNYEATLIKTPLELHREGESMHHCVGGYASSVKSGDYLVYSIKKDGERVSTLGVRVVVTVVDQPPLEYDRDRKPLATPRELPAMVYKALSINQHYGKYNSKVVEETPLQLADLVVESLNELMKNH